MQSSLCTASGVYDCLAPQSLGGHRVPYKLPVVVAVEKIHHHLVHLCLWVTSWEQDCCVSPDLGCGSPTPVRCGASLNPPIPIGHHGHEYPDVICSKVSRSKRSFQRGDAHSLALHSLRGSAVRNNPRCRRGKRPRVKWDGQTALHRQGTPVRG